jgi:periplasmic copper chaperone A
MRAASLLVGALLVAACRPSRGGSAQAGDIAITHAVVPAPASPSEAAAFLTINNLGLAVDTLVAAASPDARQVMLHEMASGRMQATPVLVIPPGGPVRLAPGSFHAMLAGLTRPLAIGDTVTLELQFARAGRVTVRAPVLRFTEAVEESSDPHH